MGRKVVIKSVLCDCDINSHGRLLPWWCAGYLRPEVEMLLRDCNDPLLNKTSVKLQQQQLDPVAKLDRVRSAVAALIGDLQRVVSPLEPQESRQQKNVAPGTRNRVVLWSCTIKVPPGPRLDHGDRRCWCTLVRMRHFEAAPRTNNPNNWLFSCTVTST